MHYQYKTQSTRKYHTSQNDTRRHLRTIIKTNTKKKAEKSNEKDYTHTKLTRTRTKSMSPSYWWSQVLDSKQTKKMTAQGQAQALTMLDT